MRLLRVGDKGAEIPALLDENNELRSLEPFKHLTKSEFLCDQNLDRLRNIDSSKLPKLNGQRIGACIANPGKFLCVGLNYADHAAETNSKLPSEPIIFGKASSAVCGPNDNVFIPYGSTKTDWEVELGVIIGTAGKYISEKNALNHVAGYCVVNDLSERAFQLEGTGQWIKGKSCDTFGPLGPWLVTRDEIPDPQDLDLWLKVDDVTYQKSNTSQMTFSVAYLISYLSRFFTLHPGDIISTGTPAGVGLAQKPNPIFLKPNQTITLGITKLGVQTQKTVQEERHVNQDYAISY